MKRPGEFSVARILMADDDPLIRNTPRLVLDTVLQRRLDSINQAAERVNWIMRHPDIVLAALGDVGSDLLP